MLQIFCVLSFPSPAEEPRHGQASINSGIPAAGILGYGSMGSRTRRISPPERTIDPITSGPSYDATSVTSNASTEHHEDRRGERLYPQLYTGPSVLPSSLHRRRGEGPEEASVDSTSVNSSFHAVSTVRFCVRMCAHRRACVFY